MINEAAVARVDIEQALKMSEMFKSYEKTKYHTKLSIGPGYCRLSIGYIHSNGFKERAIKTFHFHPDGTYDSETHL